MFALLLVVVAGLLAGLIVAFVRVVSVEVVPFRKWPEHAVGWALLWFAITAALVWGYGAYAGSGDRRFDAALRYDLRESNSRYWFILATTVCLTGFVWVSALWRRGGAEPLWDGLWDPLITLLTFLVAISIYFANRIQQWEAKLPRRLDAHYRLIIAPGESVPILSLHRAELSGESDIRTFAQGVLQGLQSEWSLSGRYGAMRPYFDIEAKGATPDEQPADGRTRWFFLYRVTLFLKSGTGKDEINSWPSHPGTEQPDVLPEGWAVVPMKEQGPGYVVWTRLQADYPDHDSFYVTAACASDEHLDPQRGQARADSGFLISPPDDWFERIERHVLGAELKAGLPGCGCRKRRPYTDAADRAGRGGSEEG